MNLPADGRVTRELSPIRSLDDTSTAPLPRPQTHFESIPEYDDSQPQTNWQSNHNGEGNVESTAMQYAHTLPIQGSTTDVFGSYPVADYSQAQPQYGNDNNQVNGNVNGDVNGNVDGSGPLPNPSFVFGDVHNDVDPMNNLATYGIDETYLAMQDRSRLGSMASIGTFNSEVPSEVSDFNGLDYLNSSEEYDMYTRRSSAPAGLVNGLGMIGLNGPSGSGSGSGQGTQPIRPSPLGQNHSVSSDHIATTAYANGMTQSPSYAYGGGYANYNVGLGMPSTSQSSNGEVYDQGQGQQGSMTTSPTDFVGNQQYQPANNGWSNNVTPTSNSSANGTYIPMSSRHTSNSTENIYTPYDQNHQFQGQGSMPSNHHSSGSGSSASTYPLGEASGSGSGSGSGGDENANNGYMTAEQIQAQLATIDWARFAGGPDGSQNPSEYVNDMPNGSDMSNGNVNGNGNGMRGNVTYLPSLNYADAVINEEDENEAEDEEEEEVEEEEEDLEKEDVRIGYSSDQLDQVNELVLDH